MRRVLVVEDDELMREGIAMVLEAEGFEAREAPDGAVALEVLRDGWQADLILLDLMMPRVNGAQFRAAQLADPAIAGIPVVVLSGHADVKAQAAALDPVGWLQKPFAMRSLVETVRRACLVDT